MGDGPSEPVVRAAIDCGANSVHVLVALAQDDRLRPLMDESTFLGLGVAARRGRLGDAKISELVATVVRYADGARRLGAGQVLVVGTDPFRRARDAATVVAQLRQAADLELAILSVEEEALLTLLGVTEGRRVDHSLSVCDIGGGSTEVAFLEPGRPPRAVAIHAGSASLPERLNPGDPPTRADISNLRAAAAVAVRRAHLPRTERFVAVGGTSTNLLRLLAVASADPPRSWPSAIASTRSGRRCCPRGPRSSRPSSLSQAQTTSRSSTRAPARGCSSHLARPATCGEGD